jgi:hypothetical protein
MGSYVLAFRAVPDRVMPEGADEAWGAWFGQLGAAIADRGNRVGQVSRLNAVNSMPATEVLSGYVVINAADMESAVTLAKGCPGLASGVSVEVAEVVDI